MKSGARLLVNAAVAAASSVFPGVSNGLQMKTGGILQICWPEFPAIARAPVEKLFTPAELRKVTGKMVGTVLGPPLPPQTLHAQRPVQVSQ